MLNKADYNSFSDLFSDSLSFKILILSSGF